MTMETLWRHMALPVVAKDNTKALRDFCWQFSLFFGLIFMGLLPWLFTQAIPFWPLVPIIYLLGFGWLYTPAVYPVYRVWMVFASVLSYTNTYILLGLVYFIVLVPLGLILQVLGKLDYRKKAELVDGTYYRKREDVLTKERLRQPF